jgi:CheY-like chemotaxis protein
MLRTADRRKDEFLATLAHELRNPLAPIRSVASVIKLKELQDPQLRTARDILDRQVRQISRLVDDLLDVSRITRGKIELRRERVAISAVVEQAVETSLPAIQAGRHELSFERGAEELWLDADPIRLAQVVANLLTNAARYTPPGGKIVVGAERSGCEAVLRVRDTGIGIPPEMLTRIFDMFTQVDPAPGQARGGLGIGLQIVKRLVELHGGRVEAASAGPGQGSEFTVRLPLGRGGDPRPGAKDAVVAPDPPGGHRVLVIDDNRDAADALAMWVELVGSDVRTAYTAGDGLALASEFRPDVVLLDIGLPDLSGYEVARLLRARPETSGAFLVATTGWGQPEDRRRSAEAGFDHHLVKPLDADDVVTLLGAPA